MSISTVQTLQDLVADKVQDGKTEPEAMAEICSAIDDMNAVPGIIRGLDSVERGETMSLEKAKSQIHEYIKTQTKV